VDDGDVIDEDDPVLRSVRAYSAAAAAYATTYAHRMLDRPERFAASLPLPALILDAGCGPGRDLRIFAEYGHVPIGADLNPEFVAMAAEHGPTVRCDLREVATRFPASTFHGIWAQASLVHLSRAEVADVLDQFRRLLRPGGRFFTCVSSSGTTGWLDEPDGRRWYTVWGADEFADVVASCGLRVDEVLPGPYVEVWATRP
jgi:SAM-dependent methyltransferase